MIKSILAAAALAIGIAGAALPADAKAMHKTHHHAMSHKGMCFHTVKGKKHWSKCHHAKAHHHAAKHHAAHHAKKAMKKM